MQPSEDSLAVTLITRWKLPIVHTWLDFQQILNHEDKICHMTWTLHVTFHYICIIIVVSYFLYSKYVHYYVIDRNIQNVIFILHKSNYYFECYWTWNNVCITSTISGKEQERIVPGESYIHPQTFYSQLNIALIVFREWSRLRTRTGAAWWSSRSSWRWSATRWRSGRLPNCQTSNMLSKLQVSDEEIEEAFKMFDRDNSGTINHNEVK